MSIWDRLANSIHNIVVGDRKRRRYMTPLLAVMFFGLLLLFIVIALWLDGIIPWLHFSPPTWIVAVAIVLMVAGAVLTLWTVIQFILTRGTPVPANPPPKLITSGLYAYIRNPMALGLLLLLIGLGIIIGSLSLAFFFGPLFIAMYGFFIRAVEEKELEMRFGQEYVDYKKRVPMFTPRLRRRA